MPFLSGLILMSAPVKLISSNNSFFKNVGIFCSGFLYFFLPNRGIAFKRKNIQEQNKVEEFVYEPKEFYFVLTICSMRLGLRKTRKNLPEIKTDTLLIHDVDDKVTNFEDSVYVQNHISSKYIDFLKPQTPMDVEPYSSRHGVLSYKHSKDKTINKISSFLKYVDQKA